MRTLAQQLDELLRREGGYVNHPADRGGPTKFGITEAVARANGYRGDMHDYPLDEAREVYRRIYWVRPKFDQVAQVSYLVASEMFDTGVNMGPVVAAGFLQRALNALNRNQTDYADIAQDGQIGPATIEALKAFFARRGKANGETVLLHALDAMQGERYLHLAEQRPANEAFLYGWLYNRIGNAANGG